MSTVRYFDSIPHIVRYGMQDEKGGKSWVLFWRNAVCFRVTVSLDDVRGTPFADRWLALNKENRGAEGVRRWVEQWNELCDCIITQCMPTLQELAPPGRQWVTLEDHLRTPAYELKMVADGASGDAVAEVTSGPVEKPSYEHHLIPRSQFQSLPRDLPVYQARDLVVLGQDKDWRHPPAKVRSPTGDLFYFLPCNRTSKNVSTGKVSNSSVEKINAYSRLHSVLDTAADVHVPRLLGVVLSETGPMPGQSDPDEALATATPSESGTQASEPQVAGVLLPYLSKARMLADITKSTPGQAGVDLPSDAKEKWRAQVVSAIRHLHDHGIAMGGRSDPNSAWTYINQYTIRLTPVVTEEGSDSIDRAKLVDADAWLMIQTPCTVSSAEGERSQEERESLEQMQGMDWQAVEKLFGS